LREEAVVIQLQVVKIGHSVGQPKQGEAEVDGGRWEVKKEGGLLYLESSADAR
jgi:hypothetical protein